MSFAGNLIWLIFGGLLSAVGYMLGGLILCLTIVGIPFGLRAIEIGVACFAPFGKQIVPKERGAGCLPLGFNIVWIVLFGWEIMLVHLIFGVLLAITIVGLPFARQHFKLMNLAFMPFSYELA